MSTSMRIMTSMLVTLALAGVANAQTNDPCPECDPDGPAGTNSSYSSIDLGVVDPEDAEVLADSDASFSDSRSQTFFAWLSLCLSVFLEGIEEALGIHLGIDHDAQVDAYVSEHGVDLDAVVTKDGETVLDLDETPAGGVDDASWEVVGEIRSATGLDLEGGVGDLVPENLDVDLCLVANVLAEC